MRNPFPSFSELVQFRNQYTIAKNLDLPSIVKPLTLEPYENAYALVMEDFGGISLKEVLKREGNLGHGLTAFLQIAIQIASALDGLYRYRVIHKDLKPANIVIHPDSKQVKLIAFSIASLLPRETQEIQNANALEGTLAYLSPEQTGRMNRGIDYRRLSQQQKSISSLRNRIRCQFLMQQRIRFIAFCTIAFNKPPTSNRRRTETSRSLADWTTPPKSHP
nr:protein kinase [Phormidesmis priestleyi]